ncbi:MAG TPA: hypothetical protein VM008_05555 [Phycisphaerae bacterium]|nr:hypothetical protein [Phycisphaerae bacterium]
MKNDELREALNEAESLQRQFANLHSQLRLHLPEIPGDFLDPTTPPPAEIPQQPTQPTLF